ncbi:MAG: AbrB/MazE/SpoVT family DNA-binding domain-containing protein [Candidatus Anammoxibacter sp.]
MAHLVKIGNSQGIKIPKNLITKARFEGKELNIQVFKGGLYLSLTKDQGKAGRKLLTHQ